MQNETYTKAQQRKDIATIKAKINALVKILLETNNGRNVGTRYRFSIDISTLELDAWVYDSEENVHLFKSMSLIKLDDILNYKASIEIVEIALKELDYIKNVFNHYNALNHAAH